MPLDVRKAVLGGNTGEYSHAIIVCDTFDYDDYVVYVKKGEDIHSKVQYYNDFMQMRRIMEIYNYSLDINKQLNESKAWHIEPICEIKKEVKETKKPSSKTETKEEDEVEKILQENNISKNLEEAIKYAVKMHEGQKRQNGDPYIYHPLRVLKNILKYKKSKNLETLLISACLHDVIEDTKATYPEIVDKFGPQVASLVLEVTTDEDMKKALGKERYLSIKMKNMSSWALVIKLCDRLDNVSDLIELKDEKFVDKYVNETIEIMNYLLKNAKLSKTHMNIIERILYTLILLGKNDVNKISRISEVLDMYYKLKENKNSVDETLSELAKIANNSEEKNKVKQKNKKN
ncbi:MAG: bifunctional (p)ppGpp synthetase/guanosine-3',5'-bis(diphosphate) 3'-pyrophosphohydrolase [Bacilli bacterium]|nr:bifunctional (p)ppGpp synthetase/guanosine-3',5'-bis(diphosphate) 3'-pyrophosphohydrolase [Bacilli bacterium]